MIFQGRKADVQSGPNRACWGAVCAGADWSLSTLPPTPTGTSQKQDKQTENSARMHFIEGNPLFPSRFVYFVPFSVYPPSRRDSDQPLGHKDISLLSPLPITVPRLVLFFVEGRLQLLFFPPCTRVKLTTKAPVRPFLMMVCVYRCNKTGGTNNFKNVFFFFQTRSRNSSYTHFTQ